MVLEELSFTVNRGKNMAKDTVYIKTNSMIFKNEFSKNGILRSLEFSEIEWRRISIKLEDQEPFYLLGEDIKTLIKFLKTTVE